MNLIKKLFNRIFRRNAANNYINMKIADIYEQIHGIQCTKMNKIKPIGAKEPHSPDYLIKFHGQRIDILKKMAQLKSSEIKQMHNSYLKDLCLDCQYEFHTHTTIGSPCEEDFENYCMIVLASEVLHNGR